MEQDFRQLGVTLEAAMACPRKIKTAQGKSDPGGRYQRGWVGQAGHKEDPGGQGLSASAFGAGLFSVIAEGGGSGVYRRAFSSIPGLYPPDRCHLASP